MAKTYPFRGRGFHTPVGYKVINKQMIVHILIVNTAFYIHGNIRLKEISILNWFEQIQENIIAGSAFSARQLGRGFHTRPTISDWNALLASIIASFESSEDPVVSFTSLVRSRD